MKKLICILFGVFTFSVGFWVFQMCPPATSVSLCEVAETPENYLAKQIKVKAFLARGGYYDVISDIEAVDYKSDCDSKIIINLSDDLKRTSNFSKISNELEQNRSEWQKGLQDGWAVTEAEFIGELTEASKSGLSAKRYFTLEPVEVKQIAPMIFVTPKEVSPLNKKLSLN